MRQYEAFRRTRTDFFADAKSQNNYMVEQSDVVIAVWNGKPSGTGNTVKMAKLLGKKISIKKPI